MSRVVLSVGCDSYTADPEYGNLSGAEEDARKIYEVLAASNDDYDSGMSRLLLSPTHDELGREIDALFDLGQIGVRRVHEGGIELMERAVESADGRMALCVFWSVEHARRDMYANGCYPEDGWRAIERDHEELALVFELLNQLGEGKPRLAYIEPAPGALELCALVEPAELIEVLRECAGEEAG